MKHINQNDAIFQWKENAIGIEFCLLCDFKNVPFTQWIDIAKSYETKSQCLFLKELIDNGEAENTDNSVMLSNEIIFELDSDDLRLLNLPEIYPFDIKIEAFGTLNEEEFKYNLSFCDFNDATIFTNRTGCIIRISDERFYRLSKEQFCLVESIKHFNNLVPNKKQYTDNLLAFSEIKELSKQTGTTLDKYLNNTNVITTKKIRLRLNRTGNTLEIIPEIKELSDTDNTAFTQSFDLYPSTQNVYTIQTPNGERQRVLFDNEQKEALSEIKKRRRIAPKEAQKILEHPQEYFDPEVIELEPTDEMPLSFSERVKEIGFYKPRMYPFVFPYQSKWLPGIIIEDNDGQQQKIEIKTQEDITKIEYLINEARKEKATSIEWKDKRIPINQIIAHLPFIKQQIENPKYPSKKNKSDGEPVLIIKENIDYSEYVISPPPIPHSEFKPTYEPPPNLISGIDIFPHQQEGIAWLQDLLKHKFPGGLLADDMGLGKTLQVLSFIIWHNKNIRTKKTIKKPYLVVAPVTLLENWESEYHKFFDMPMNLITLYGEQLKYYKHTDKDKPIATILGMSQMGMSQISKIREKRGALDYEKLKSSDIVLTTYETVRDFQIDLGLIHWAVVIIDEAQKIKTPGALVTRASKALKTDFRIACTGTPIENSLVDLWCINDFTAPGCLGTAKDFAKKYQHPIKSSNANTIKMGKDLQERIGIYMLRRLKKDILKGLPEKILHVEKYPMPEVQLQHYIEEIKAVKERNKNIIFAKDGWLIEAINALKHISAHPFLSDFDNEIELESFICQSAKLIKTIEILETIKQKKEKVVLYSESRISCRMLLKVVCNKFGLNENEIYIVNGDMPGNKQKEQSMKVSRQTAINRFESKEGFNVIIMSPLAAGIGLNITKANHVIHYSRWWNPAKEEQANDRVYRIGQELPVHIYFPIATANNFKTFDVILDELLEKKKNLISDTLFPIEQIEITPEEFIENIETNIPDTDNTQRVPVKMKDIHSMDPLSFEALIGAIFQDMNKNISLTPEQNDKGVDVIVWPDNEDEKGVLVQVKHTRTKKKIDAGAIKEVFAAQKFYEKIFSAKFECSAVTNSEFTNDAIELANANGVKLMNKNWLEENLETRTIHLSDISKIFFQRIKI